MYVPIFPPLLASCQIYQANIVDIEITSTSGASSPSPIFPFFKVRPHFPPSTLRIQTADKLHYYGRGCDQVGPA